MIDGKPDANQKQLNLRDLRLREFAFLAFTVLVPFAANAQPAAPSNLLATAGDEAAALAWYNPFNSDIVRYEFRFRADEAPEFPAWAEVPNSDADTVEHTVSGLTNGTRYIFEVRAADDDGAGEAARASTILAASPSSAVEVSDAGLREAIEETLELASDAPITQGDLARLVNLLAHGKQITDLAGLEFAINLVVLDLATNAISDLSALSDLTSLGSLALPGNAISDVSALSGLTSLTVLNLAANAISDISALSGLTSLMRLRLFDNELSDVSALSGLTSLTTLYLDNNAITDGSALSGLVSLTGLGLAANELSDISALSGLTSLTWLLLHSNTISDISPLGGLEQLQLLVLRRNAIADMSPLLTSGLSGTGDYVDLRDNPLGEGQGAHVEELRESGTAVLLDDGGHRVPLFPSAASAAAGSSITGFVRVINHSDEAGSVSIEAVDETSERRGPESLAIEAGQVLHFNAEDLEQGSPAKGLRGVGEAVGDWRLVLRSDLDIEVLGYARTPDGFVTSLHDLVPEGNFGFARVPTFNPGSNRRQVSLLRLTNPTDWDRLAYFTATDDAGANRSCATRTPAGRTLEFTAAELESGEGVCDFSTSFGDGSGKWRLRAYTPGLRVMSVLQSPTGHLANISTGTAVSLWHRAYYSQAHGGRYRVPLFLAASSDIQGFLRIVNLNELASTAITLRTFDGSGVEREPTVLTLKGGGAMHLNSEDLESGNAAKGLPGIGAATGDWHLEVRGDGQFEVLTYARAADGFVTSLHDVAPRLQDGSLWIPFFNPGSNRNQASRLRLVNWGETAAEVTITGTDDAGKSPGEAVRVTVPGRSARDYMAWELETGSAADLSGALGDGAGKWRLQVSAPGDVEAMSLLGLPTGHITNLSTTPRHPRE